MTVSVDARSITKSSRSNLAMAFFPLPRDRREAMTTFYAFCRIVDDIADDGSLSDEGKSSELDVWRRAVRGRTEGEHPIAPQVRGLADAYGIDPVHLEEIIAGMEMDIGRARYETFDDLSVYCRRVASEVGVASIRIFGCRHPDCTAYAENLGMALQLTNIIRDVGEDWRNGGRIYLPAEDMRRFGVGESMLGLARTSSELAALLDFESGRAWEYYKRSDRQLPRSERRRLVASRIMRSVYGTLLRKMKADGFDVLQKKYRLGRLEKAWCVVKALGWM